MRDWKRGSGGKCWGRIPAMSRSSQVFVPRPRNCATMGVGVLSKHTRLCLDRVSGKHGRSWCWFGAVWGWNASLRSKDVLSLPTLTVRVGVLFRGIFSPRVLLGCGRFFVSCLCGRWWSCRGCWTSSCERVVQNWCVVKNVFVNIFCGDSIFLMNNGPSIHRSGF